jgi:hypothetical protein
MKVISSPTSWAACLGALLLTTGFPERTLAKASRLGGASGNQEQVYRLAGQALAKTRQG